MSRIVNPPDIAVALHYDGVGAPRVTAKGEGATAERIVELAKESDVPLHSDPGLVKVLANVPLGEEIPRELYLAAAEIIAFAYLLAGKMPEGWREDSTES